MKKSIYSSKSSVCYLLGLIYYTGFSEKTVFCLKNEYLGSSFLVPGIKFFAKVLCDLFLKDLWTFLREKRKTLCSPVMARVMELLLDHRCNWRIWPLSRALQLGLEAAFAEGTGWSRATQILLLQEPLVLPAPWWRWGTWCGRWLLLQNILLCAVLHIWVCRNAAAVTIAREAGLGAAGPGGALVLWGCGKHPRRWWELFAVDVVECCAIPDILQIGFAQCYLIFWWISEEDSSVSTRYILLSGTG